MLISGSWFRTEDDRMLPVLRVDIAKADGARHEADFLVDTGADCSVFNAEVLRKLLFETSEPIEHLSGIGGTAETVAVGTKVRFTRDDGGVAVFESRFAAFMDPRSLDMSVLGRDILNLFTLVVDRQSEIVCLLRAPHRIVIHSA